MGNCLRVGQGNENTLFMYNKKERNSNGSSFTNNKKNDVNIYYKHDKSRHTKIT